MTNKNSKDKVPLNSLTYLNVLLKRGSREPLSPFNMLPELIELIIESEEEIESLRSTESKLNDQIYNLEHELEKLKEDYENLQCNFDDLEKQEENVSEELEELKEDYEDLQTSFYELKEEHSKLYDIVSENSPEYLI